MVACLQFSKINLELKIYMESQTISICLFFMSFRLQSEENEQCHMVARDAIQV